MAEIRRDRRVEGQDLEDEVVDLDVELVDHEVVSLDLGGQGGVSIPHRLQALGEDQLAKLRHPDGPRAQRLEVSLHTDVDSIRHLIPPVVLEDDRGRT
jgi:hypothetical protein